MASNAIKVKAFADSYGLTSKEVLKELAAQGYANIRTASNNIPPDDYPVIKAYFDEMMAKRGNAPAEPAKPAPAKASSKAPVKAAPAKPAAEKAPAKPAPVPAKPAPAPAKPAAEKAPAKPAPAPAPAKPAPAPAPAKPAPAPAPAAHSADVESLIEEVESKLESSSGGQAKQKKQRPADEGQQKNRFDKGGKFNGRNNNNGRPPFDKQRHEEEAPAAPSGEVHIKPPVVVKALADALGKRPNEVISTLMMMNVLASINQTVEPEVAQKVAEKWNITLVIDRRDKEEHAAKQQETEEIDPEDAEYEDNPKDLKPRPPIVTFMGHVDHGKTSLQDAIRKTHVTATEAGGITQHIGASAVTLDGKVITFVDTPGHEAFTQMRARGANVTDVVVLVVAADDGFMPQTIEAMNHALAAKVPIIVAMNKCDLPTADTQKVLLNMQQNGLTSEDWGGTVAAIPVSAKTGAGISDLLERILLEAEMLELKANPKRPGIAFVLESQLEQGFGPTASVVVKNGSLRVGDPVICGEHYGKIKTLIDFRGHRIAVAPPSMPVKVVGLSGVPEAGTKMAVCKSMNEAKELAEKRGSDNRIENLSAKTSGASLEDLFSQMDDTKKNSLKVIVKTDVRGSSEAIVESLKKLPSDKISVEVLHAGVGAITENDVLLAASSDAIVVGFHVRVNPGVNDLAKKQNVEIRLYSIIYELLEDITDALAGKLEPEKREKELGTVRILKIFTLSDGTKICGCKVEKGIAKVGSKARVYRNKELIFNGEVRSLRHVKDAIKEAHQGMECGIRLDNFMDFTEGDTIQMYEIELKKATL